MSFRGRSGRIARALLAGAFAAATIALFVISRGKWCDAVVDVGREWILADRLNRGELLYRDIVYWFGPFTPYFESVFFRVFGSSFTTLILAGVVGSAAVLAALFLAVREVAGRRSALVWTALAVPALVFMPYSGGSILAMGHRMWHAAGFSLLALALSSRRDAGRRLVLAGAAGALAGLAGLCRTEWGAVTLAAVALAEVLPPSPRRGAVERVLSAAAAAAIVWGGVMAFFVWRAGAAAVFRDGRLLLVGLPSETRHFLWTFSGAPRWHEGLATLAYSACVWFAVLFAVPSLAAPGFWRKPSARLLLLGLPAAGLLLAWRAGASMGGVLFSAAPAVALAALLAGLTGAAGPRGPALAAFGLAGLVLSIRRPLDIRDAGYVAPPLLLAVVCAAGLLRLAARRARSGSARPAYLRNMRVAIGAAAALFFLLRAQHYAADARVPIPGTGGCLSASRAFVAEIEGLVRTIRQRTGPGDGLAVVPEGAVLNFLAQRRSPSRYELLIPGYLTESNEPAVIRDFERDPPAAIVLWRGATEEYGFHFFGQDYGKGLAEWIGRHYDFVDFPNPERKVEGGPTRLAIRRRSAVR